MTTRLLVADDSPTIRKVVALSFLGEDVVVEGVESGEEACQRAASWIPDVVLADALMPGCSGYEVCRRVKATPELARTRVVLLVGALEPFDEQAAAVSGCDGRLTKPFDSRELVNLVHRLADKSRPGADPPGPPAEPVHFASNRTVHSFLGDDRILDLVDVSILSRPTEPAAPTESAAPDSAQAAALSPAEQAPAVASGPEVRELDARVEARIRELAPGIIRELAGEILRDLLSQSRTPEPPRG